MLYITLFLEEEVLHGNKIQRVGGIEIKHIGTNAFHTCNNIKSITIPDSVTSIGEDAFVNCISLTSITIPSSVTNIEQSAFFGCNNATFYVGNEKTKQLILNSSSKIDSNKIIIKL